MQILALLLLSLGEIAHPCCRFYKIEHTHEHSTTIGYSDAAFYLQKARVLFTQAYWSVSVRQAHMREFYADGGWVHQCSDPVRYTRT